MGRKPKIIKPVQLCLKLPQDLLLKLQLHLYSEVEGRVPQGSYQEFFTELLQDYFAEKAPLREIRNLIEAVGLKDVVARIRSIDEGRKVLQHITTNQAFDKATLDRITHLLENTK